MSSAEQVADAVLACIVSEDTGFEIDLPYLSGKLSTFAYLLPGAARLLRPLLSGGQVRLRLQVDPRTPPAYADAQAVRRILGNLVSNAVKFTEEGEIAIALRPVGPAGSEAAGAAASMVEVQVRDTGPGIARGELSRLFEEFSQGSPPRLPHAHAGIGLGLSIARRLTELHGGQIAAASEPGQGATFTFTLPAATLEQLADSAPPPTAWGHILSERPTAPLPRSASLRAGRTEPR